MTMLSRGAYSIVRSRGLRWMALLLVVGCGRGHEKETASVRGTVILDGAPYPGGSVMFVPAEGRGATGNIDAQGNFVLSTYGNGDGAIVGRHQIAIFPAKGGFESSELPAGYRPLPSQYQNTGSSGLEREVVADQENVFDLQLKSNAR